MEGSMKLFITMSQGWLQLVSQWWLEAKTCLTDMYVYNIKMFYNLLTLLFSIRIILKQNMLKNIFEYLNTKIMRKQHMLIMLQKQSKITISLSLTWVLAINGNWEFIWRNWRISWTVIGQETLLKMMISICLTNRFHYARYAYTDWTYLYQH